MPLYDAKLVSALRRFRFLAVPAKEAQRAASLLLRPRLIARYLKAHAVRKLQLGAAVSTLPGWLNSDLYPKGFSSIALDATKRFPFPDASFDYVFSEHQMEHIPYEGARFMLAECHRILRPGSKIRIAVPSLDKLIELLGQRSELQERYVAHKTEMCYPGAKPNTCFAFNANFMNWGHRFIYDQETLCIMLRNAGFSDVRFFPPGESDDPNLRGIEVRTGEFDLCETTVMQAVKI